MSTTLYLCLVSWIREVGAKQPKPGTIREKYFEYHDGFPPNAVAQITKWVSEGREVFMVAALLTAKSRKKEHAADLWSVWVECDRNPGFVYSRFLAEQGARDIPCSWMVPGVPMPSVVVESSPGRFYFFWRLNNPIDPRRGEQLNERLTRAVGADPSGWDATQLLRVVGSRNYKYSSLPIVRRIKDGDEVYSADELESMLPEISKPAAVTRAKIDGEEPPVVLVTAAGQEIWKGQRPTWTQDGLDRIVDRSKTLFKIAHTLADANATRSGIASALEERDRTLFSDHPKGTKYADRPSYYLQIADEVISKREQEAAQTGPVAVVTRFSDIEELPTEWLWEPYIPLGMVSLLDGNPMMGKSSLAVAMSAAVSTGRSLPGATMSAEPGVVILASAEEDPARTIKKRLRTARADEDRVHLLAGFRIEEPNLRGQQIKQVTLDNVALLEQVLRQYRPRLLVFDPVQAFFGATHDMNRANEVRPILAGLKTLAEEHRCTILLLRHLVKRKEQTAMYAGQGNIDFMAAARTALFVGYDPRDPSKTTRILSQSKSNIARLGPSLTYVLMDEGVQWVGTADLTADEVADVEAGEKVHDAATALTELIPPGEDRPAKEVTEWALAMKISYGTLQAAKKYLRIKSERPRKSDGTLGESVWKRPTV